MALQVTLGIPPTFIPDDPEEIVEPTVYPEAYARIFQIRVNQAMTIISVCWYATAAAYAAGEPPVKMFEYNVATSELQGDIYPAAYAYLKTLPDFAGAIDC